MQKKYITSEYGAIKNTEAGVKHNESAAVNAISESLKCSKVSVYKSTAVRGKIIQFRLTDINKRQDAGLRTYNRRGEVI
jgi:hypothetical protein